jgi:hypothetical protein
MSMTRREWLTRVIGGAAAVAVAPLIDMTDMTPAILESGATPKIDAVADLIRQRRRVLV